MCYLNPTIPANKNRFFILKKWIIPGSKVISIKLISSYIFLSSDVFLYINIKISAILFYTTYFPGRILLVCDYQIID